MSLCAHAPRGWRSDSWACMQVSLPGTSTVWETSKLVLIYFGKKKKRKKKDRAFLGVARWRLKLWCFRSEQEFLPHSFLKPTGCDCVLELSEAGFYLLGASFHLKHRVFPLQFWWKWGVKVLPAPELQAVWLWCHPMNNSITVQVS